MKDDARPPVVLHRLHGTKKAQDACVLISALYDAGRRVAAWVSDPGRAAVLDQYLWTFVQSSFVPHAIWDGSTPPDDPVVIVCGRFIPPPDTDALVVVDRLDDVAGAAVFAEIHDLDAGGAEDVGKRAGWEAAGFTVTEVRGAKPVRDRTRP